MMHYKKGKNIEEELSKDNIPIDCLPTDFLWMHVKGGTTVSNVIDYAKKALDSGEHRSVVWTGSGGGVTKTISCAEILKRNYDLHQITRMCFRKVEEYWDPLMEGLEQIVASREIPCIHILMSLDEIDPKTPGHQHSKVQTKFWDEKRRRQEANADRGKPSSSRQHTGDRKKPWHEQNRRRKPKKEKQQECQQKSNAAKSDKAANPE